MRKSFTVPFLAATLIAGCKEPPTKQEVAAVDYGPRPENYEQIVRDYTAAKFPDPRTATIEFKAGPGQLYQQPTALRPLKYGWAVCAFYKDSFTVGAYGGFRPIVFFIRDGVIVGTNNEPGDDGIGYRFAETDCKTLGYNFL